MRHAICWTYRDAKHAFVIPLPQGASVVQEFANGVVYAIPDDGKVVILKPENVARAQRIVAQGVQGKDFRGYRAAYNDW